jgi:hypothetical protein
MPLIYKLFQMESFQNPEVLEALETDEVPAEEVLPVEPEEEAILERDGIHVVNSRVLNPDGETKKTLDHQFLNLVESLIKPPGSIAP